MASKTYFISGHSNVSLDAFNMLYKPLLEIALKEEELPYFLIGDKDGLDSIAQLYLKDNLPEEKHDHVKIFFKGDVPRNFLSPKFMAIADFVSSEEANIAMTFCSDEDIVCIHPQKWDSMTAKNILRRYTPTYPFHKFANAKRRNEKFWNVMYKYDLENNTNE